jgi:hypothetical protein
VVVPSIVVIVAEALAGGVTVAGLTVQLGGSVIDWIVDVTWQPRLTLPLKPLSVPTVTFEDDVPPGATASGESVSACSVKVWAAASDGKIRNAANRHKTAVSARPDHAELNGLDSNGLDFNDWDFNESAFNDSDLNVSDCKVSDFDASVLNASDCDDSDFNMSRSKFKYFDSQDNPKAARLPDDTKNQRPILPQTFPQKPRHPNPPECSLGNFHTIITPTPILPAGPQRTTAAPRRSGRCGVSGG